MSGKIDAFDCVKEVTQNPRVEEKVLGTIYDGSHGAMGGAWISYLCPCGCGADVFIPLRFDNTVQSQRWLYSKSEHGITLSPSILETWRCKSHYFIRDSKVVWV